MNLSRHFDAPGRIALAAIFVVSGLSKLAATVATQGYMEAFGVPGVLVYPTIAFESGLGLCLAFGLWTRTAALLLSGFCLITAAIFHTAFEDQVQQIMFLKNIAMAGGLLLLAGHGAQGASLDGWLNGRRSRQA